MNPGEQIPSTNEFATFFKINPATARQGINELVLEGILRKRRGVGMFVTDDGKKVLMKHRREVFFEDFILPLKNEAKKLNIPTKKLISMIEEEA